jgi:CubicO group peptidase (beta-lactamase class C family)
MAHAVHRRRLGRRALVATALALAMVAALIVAARLFASPLARPGLGFAAKVVCSAVFVGGFTPAQALTDLPDEPLAMLIRTRVDTGGARVIATVPLIARREARHRPGLGCTLEPPGGSTAVLPPSVEGGRRELPAAADEEWPLGEGVMQHQPVGVDGERLRAVVAGAFAEPDPDALRRTRAVVVVHRGRIVAEQYADGFSADHRFAGWSMAKSVTSALIGILAGVGSVHVDSAVQHPEWRAAGDPRRLITVHTLLQMSSGLEFDESYTPTGGATRMLFDSPDVAAVAAASPLAHPPGRVWQYSSATTNLLAWRLRQAFAADDAAHLDFPRRALFARIGMHSAVFEPDAAGTFVGSSFLYATARDWARFGLLYLDDGVWRGERILPEGWVAYSVTPGAAAPLGRYGAQWWLNAGEPAAPERRPWPQLPRDVFWASGFQGQYVAVVPSRELVVVRLGSTAREGGWSLGDFLIELLTIFPAAEPPRERPAAAAPL